MPIRVAIEATRIAFMSSFDRKLRLSLKRSCKAWKSCRNCPDIPRHKSKHQIMAINYSSMVKRSIYRTIYIVTVTARMIYFYSSFHCRIVIIGFHSVKKKRISIDFSWEILSKILNTIIFWSHSASTRRPHRRACVGNKSHLFGYNRRLASIYERNKSRIVVRRSGAVSKRSSISSSHYSSALGRTVWIFDIIADHKWVTTSTVLCPMRIVL